MTTFTQLHSPSFIALLTAGLDGFADVVTGPGVGGGPQVRVFSPRRSFFLDDFFLPHMPGSTPGALVGNIAPDPFFSGDFFPAIIPETAGLVRRDSPGTSFDRSISTGSHVLISAAASAAHPLNLKLVWESLFIKYFKLTT